VDGRTITGVDDLLRALDGESIGRPVEFAVIRRGELVRVPVTPGERRRG
jgi:S1-C subfamily serine protease